jgi:ribosomal protein S18 acetylase RimI-like enzyme
VYVAPESRRNGVFRALYRHLGELATQAGNVSGFRLYVEQENHRAQETYRKLGMEPSHYRCFEVDFVFGAFEPALKPA